MSQLIKLKRGEKASLPVAANLAEPVYVTDTRELFIGTGTGLELAVTTVGDNAITKELLNPDVAGKGLAVDTDGSIMVQAGDGIDVVNDTVLVKLADSSVAFDQGGLKINAIDGGSW